MYSLRERSGSLRERHTKPIVAAKRRRQLYPFFFHMGPVALSVTSVLLIGLMAVLYLNQLGQAIGANQNIHDLRVQQAALKRENQDLLDTIAQEQSPTYIAREAQKLGLIPANPKLIQMLVIEHLKPLFPDNFEQNLRP